MWNLKKEKVKFKETVEKWLPEAEGNKESLVKGTNLQLEYE